MGSARGRRRRRPRGVRRWLRALRRAVTAVVVLVASPIPYFCWLRYHDPPMTSFQLQELMKAQFGASPQLRPHQTDMDIDDVSRNMVVAALALEDPELGTRPGGVNWDDFFRRAREYTSGEQQTSGSTVPQQSIKNLLLFRYKHPARKAVEAAWAEMYARIVPPKRQLEIYLNHVELGPGVWGVCEASWRYFDKDPAHLTIEESAALLQLLPDPKHRALVVEPAPFTRGRVDAIGGLAASERLGVAGLATDRTARSCDSPTSLSPPASLREARMLAALLAIILGVETLALPLLASMPSAAFRKAWWGRALRPDPAAARG